MSEFDKSIIEDAKKEGLGAFLKTEEDAKRFVNFVKYFALAAIHDSEIQENLFS